jgi:hypothetical protein
MSKILHKSLVISVLLASGLVPAFSALAYHPYQYQYGYYGYQNPVVPTRDPQAIVCLGLDSVGMGCSTSGIAVGNYQPKPVRLSFDILGSANLTSTSDSVVKSAVSNASAPRDLSGQKINLVSADGSRTVYELVNGQKHPFPSLAIFYDYGYKLEMIQAINQAQLDKFPRANLVKVQGSSTVYYLTEGGLIRSVVNTKKIFELYGDRAQDEITISRKEFNFYPTNQYVYQESPLNRDVFQISNGGKRYLTPMAVARLGIRADQVAPVSQAELNLYKTLAPLVD